MKKTMLLLLLLVIALSPAFAAQGDVSLGLALGQPSGIAAKYDIDNELYVHMITAFHFGSDSIYLRGTANYNFTNFSIENADFFPYVGGGVNMQIGQNNFFDFGVVVPVGVSYYFDDPPIELYLEVAPGFNLLEGDGFQVGGGIGVLYRIN